MLTLCGSEVMSIPFFIKCKVVPQVVPHLFVSHKYDTSHAGLCYSEGNSKLCNFLVIL
jgi:hypothetical protein